MLNTIKQIEENKIIVIVRGVEKEKLIPLAEAMYEGGIRIMECTYDATGKMPDEENAANIAMLAEHFGERMVVGAGTVLTEKQVRLTKEAGGKFIISPDTNEAIIKESKAQGLVSIPGAITPSEAAAASRAGADFVKMFPIDFYGPRYLKTVATPLSHVRFLAVNGINENNMNEYLEAGACGVGVGSGIVNKKLIEEGNFEAIMLLAKKYTEKLG